MNIIIWGVLIAGLLLIYIKRRGGKLVPSFPHLPQINFPTVDYRASAYVVGTVVLAALVWILKPWTWWQEPQSFPSSGALIWWGLVLLFFASLAAYKLPKKWRILGYVLVALALMTIIIGVTTSGLGKWTSRTFESVVQRCLGEEDCPEETASARAPAPAVQEIAAGSYGTQLAPVGTWSVWLKLPETTKRLCARFVTDNSWADDLKVRYVDEEGLPWLGGDDIHNATHISFRSNLEAPVLVQYSLWETAGNCVRA